MTREPKILLFDIETSPVLAWTFNIGHKVSIGHHQIQKGQRFDIICICYKWANEKKIHSLDWGINKQDSSKMLQDFSKIAEEADLVIGHNVDKFDIRQVNTQRLLHNQAPISWPTSEDTLKQFRKYFYLPSYKLDYISTLLTGSGKDRMEFRDWIDIVEDKDPKALAKMIKYCKKDVQKLNEVWKYAAKYMEPRTHAGIISGVGIHSCPRCAGEDCVRYGYKTLKGGKYQVYQCKSCGSKWRDSKRV